MTLLDKFPVLRKKGKTQDTDSEEKYLDLIEQDPEDAKARLKLAEIYEKNREKQKAVSEYLLAADIFVKRNFYAGAMAIYKKLVRQDPTQDQVYLKIADIYRKMGFLGDALAQYRVLVQHYESLGMKDKVSEVMRLMAQVDLQKAAVKEVESSNVAQPPKGEERSPSLGEVTSEAFFDLRTELKAAGPLEMKNSQEVSTLEKLYGIEDIFKELKEIGGPSAAEPHFNYDLGVAYAKMGFFDDAVEQLLVAVSKGQKPFEAATMLGFCYKKKGMLEEAGQSFEKALQAEGISQEKMANVKYELSLLYKEQGREEEALKLLREAVSADWEARHPHDEIVTSRGNVRAEGNLKLLKT